jgi:uncharacterized membrane protein
MVWLAAGLVTSYLPLPNQTPLTVIIAVPLVLFIPGYCLVAALFPKNDAVDLVERITLSFGLSIAVASLIGLALNFTPFGIRLAPVVISLSVFTLVMILAAHYRRSLLPRGDRFRIPFSEIAGNLWNGMFPEEGSKLNRVLTVVVTLSILTAVLATAYVIVVPKEGERFTEFFILGEKQKAADYPEIIITGMSYPMYVGVGNHEYRSITYTIETWGVFMESDNVTNTSRITAMDPLDRLSVTLAHNETLVIPYNLTVKKTGYNRVDFLLFNQTVPGFEVINNDRINASSHDLHLWIRAVG